MMEQPSTWDDVRRLADDLELKVRLARRDVRDRWRELVPRLTEIEKSIASAGRRTTETVERELASVGAALRRLRDDITKH